ncbi:hypothetical protein NBRC116590_02780 [Pelagimonas sp. KU-00592-HH]|uniref:hypothetical protein n=1 Tax=Pelagimonas sp. KU-00592-HH TaxID=3127651 RepID=UPI00310AA34C
MTFYDDLAGDVTDLLEELGQVGQVRRLNRTGGAASSTTAGATAPEDFDAKMAVLPVDDKRVDGTNIFVGDFQVIVEALTGGITKEDKIVCTEGTLTIRKLGKIAPAGTIVAYDMVCHR